MYRATIQASIGQDSVGSEQKVYDTSTNVSRSSPSWEKELQDIVVLDKQPGVELVCICRGLTHPSVKWFHKGREVFSDFHMKLRQVSNTATLTIKNIREHDSGKFRCVMTGENGELETSCTLSIKEPDRIEPPIFLKEIHDVEIEEGEKLELAVEVREVEHPEPPGFITCPSKVTALEGEAVTFTCQVKGQPLPNVLWERGGVVIATSHKYKITKIQDHHSLTVYNTDQTDAGEYICHLHSSESDASHVCSLRVVCKNIPQALEKTETFKTRSPHADGLQSMSRTDFRSFQKEEHKSATPDLSLRLNNSKLRNMGENVGETTTAKSTYSASFKTTAGITITHQAGSYDALRTDYDALRTDYGNNRNQTQQRPQTDTQNFKSDIRQKPETPQLTKGKSLEEPESRQNVPETSTTGLTQNYRKVDEKKSVINANVTDFRSVLKSRDWTSPSHAAKPHNTDFRNVLSRDQVKPQDDRQYHTDIPREGVTTYDSTNLPNIQTSVLSQSGNFTSIPQLTSAISSQNHQNDNQSLKNLANNKIEGNVNVHGLTSAPKNQRNFDSSAQSAIEVSLIEKRDWRTSRNIPEHSSVPSQSLNRQELLQPSVLEKSGHGIVNVGENNVEIVRGTNHPDSSSISDMRAERDSLDSKNGAQDESLLCDTNGRETLFRSEIQILDTRKRGGRDQVTRLSENEEITIVASLNTRTDGNQVRGKNYLSDKNTQHFESEELISGTKDTRKQENVSAINLEPQMPLTPPTQNDFKLEVTSVLVSKPLRSSTSSSHYQSRRLTDSLSLSDQSPVDNTSTKVEDLDDVFRDTAEERVNPDQNCNINDYRQTLQSYGSTFTRQKASWDGKDVQESNKSDIPSPDTKKNDQTENTKKTRSSSLLESKLDSFRDPIVGINSNLDSGISSQASNMSDSVNDFSSEDFRTITLNPAVSRNTSDLGSSKILSASTENLFADVKLKHVPKLDEKLRKSQKSLTAERIKDRPRGRDLADLFPKSKLDTSQINTKTSDFLTSIKASNNFQMPVNQSKYEKHIQDSKIRAVAEKYEKPFTSSEQKINTTSRSKGIGARFEQSIKDATVSNKSISNTSPNPAKIHLEARTTKPHSSSDVYSGKFVDKIQQWKTAESISTGNGGEKKMLGTIGKSNSNDAILEGGSRDYVDKVQDRLAQKRHSLEMNITPETQNSDHRYVQRAEYSTLSKGDFIKSSLCLEKTVNNLQAANSIKIPDVLSQKKELFENGNLTNISANVNETETRNVRDNALLHRNMKESELKSTKTDIFIDKNVEQTESMTEKMDILRMRKMKESESLTMMADVSQHKSAHVNTVELSERSKKYASKTVRNDQNAKPEWVNRKSVNNIEAKIKTNIAGGNQEKSKPEWTTVRPSTFIQQTNSAKANRSKSTYEPDPVHRTGRTTEEKGVSLSSTTTAMDNSPLKLSETNAVSSNLRNIESYGRDQFISKDTGLFHDKSQASQQTTDTSTSKLPNSDTVSTQNNGTQQQTAITTGILPATTYSSPSATVTASVKLVSMTGSGATIPKVTETIVSSSIPQPDDATPDDPVVTNRKELITSKRAVDQSDTSERSAIVSKSWSKDLQVITTSTLPDSLSMQASPESSTNDQSHSLEDRSTWGKQKSKKSLPVCSAHESGLSLHQDVLGSSLDDSESVLSTASISSSSSDASNVTVDSGYPRNTMKSFVNNDKLGLSSKTKYSGNDESYTVSSYTGKFEELTTRASDGFKLKEKFVESYWTRNCEGDLRSVGSDRNNQATKRDQKYTRESGDVQDGAVKGETTDESSRSAASHFREHKFVNQIEQTQQLELTEKSINKPSENSSQISKDTENVTDVKEGEEVADLSHDFGTTRKYSKKRRKNLEMQLNDGGSEDTVNKLVSKPDSDIPMSRFNRRFRETETEVNRATSDVGFKSREPSRRWNSKEVTTVFKSEEKQSDSIAVRKSRFEQKTQAANKTESADLINIRTNKINARTVDTKSLALRPSELDLSSSWKSSPSQLKKNKDVLPQQRNQEERGTQNVSNAEVETTGGYSGQSSTAVAETQPQLRPPSFPLPLQDAVVMFGSKAVLKCKLIGNPRPEVKWLLNQKLIEPSKDIEVSFTDEWAQLTVRETFTDHVGEYACWAKNPSGTVSSHCTLSLEAPPNRTESRALEGRRFAPPKIVFLSPSTVSVPRGSPLVITVTFIGEPRPAVTWKLSDRELVTDSHVQIVTEDSTSCLTIQSVKQSDAGRMSVCLSSCTGTDQATVNICIEDVPGAPAGKPHIYDIDSHSASLSWYSPASNEGSQVTHYVIEARTQEEETWEVIVPYCKDLSCHILGLNPCTVYQFQVLAANKHGLSAPSEPSEKVMTPDPFRSPSDYDSEDDFPFEPREVKINTQDKFEDVFELDKEVGKGKFGVVYKCKHRKDGTIWAAKIVKCREKDKGVIRREIDIMNKLRHPKLLLLWDAYESQRQMVLVMEYVGAGELFERVIGEDFVLTECDCVHFLRQICEGVNYMHNNNILHLDLKPENILCIAEDSNRIKIIDFGLAQFHKAGQSTKVLFGTPEFIAPEVINYDEIGFVTDMWSIGVICYVLLSGLSPFLGDNDNETLANVTTGEFDFDDEAFDEISDDAKHFISNLLIMRKEKRMLTDQCLAHVWLNPKEIGGFRSRRLNTERLKRFMVRRKWLKTGNAVLAISRLLKSSNLSGLGAMASSNVTPTSPQSGSSSPITPVQSTIAEISEVLGNQTELSSAEKSSAQSSVKNLDCISHEVGEKVNSLEENVTFSGDWKELGTADVSCIKDTTSGQTLANSAENDLNADDSDVFSLREIQTRHTREQILRESRTNHSTDQNDNQFMNNTLHVLATCGADENHNVSQLASSVLSSTTVNSNDELTARPECKQNNLVVVDGALFQAPVFTKSMMNSTACVGDVARFDVVLAGEPTPSVTWYFEDEEIHLDSRHSLDANQHSRTFSLVIRNIEVDDEGEYTCKAVNSQGENICVAELCVLEV